MGSKGQIFFEGRHGSEDREHLLAYAVYCCQIPHEEAPAKRLRLSKPSKSAALHIDLCKAASSTDALQYLLQFARKPVEMESVEGVIRILLEHYYKVKKCVSCHNWEYV